MLQLFKVKYALFIFMTVLSMTSCDKHTPKQQVVGFITADVFDVSTQKGGKLNKLYVQEGEQVKKGQPIAKIEGESILKSPGRATVLRTNYLEKEYIPPGNTVVSLILSQYIDVVFYVPEHELSNLQLGKKVFLLLQKNKYPITISYISPKAEYTPDSMFIEKQRYKSVFKVKGKLTQELLEQLHVGQTVVINYEQ